jgi:hypothetical protein
MDVGSTTRVVTWKHGCELSRSVFVSSLYASKICLVEIRVILVGVVAEVLNTGVASGGVTAPDFPEDILDWLAAVHIDELSVQDQRNARFPVCDICSDELAVNPERTDCCLRG